MARKLRVQFEGAIHHVTLRGVERRKIFTEDRERERFLERVAEGVETHDVRLYMFCLMGNHAHLLLETPHGNLDRFMHGLETAYTVYFNLRHARVGHLMQGRYGAVLVEGDEYLLRLSRYLHLNPVYTDKTQQLPAKDRLSLLRNYRWSSYLSYVGRARPLDFVDYGPVLAMTGAKPDGQPAAYRRFVETGLAKTDEEFLGILKESPLGVGSESFRSRIRDMHLDLLQKHRRTEDVSFRRIQGVVAVPTILSVVCEELGIEQPDLRRHRKGSPTRPIAAKMLCKHGGLTQRETADVLGVGTGAAVSAQLQRLQNMASKNPEIKRHLSRIDARLSEQH